MPGIGQKNYESITTATISAENTFSNDAAAAKFIKGDFNLSLSGTWVATVHVQRSFDNSTWLDVESFTANTEQPGFEPEGAYYRFGIKTGNYTSGNMVGRLSQDTTA